MAALDQQEMQDILDRLDNIEAAIVAMRSSADRNHAEAIRRLDYAISQLPPVVTLDTDKECSCVTTLSLP